MLSKLPISMALTPLVKPVGIALLLLSIALVHPFELPKWAAKINVGKDREPCYTIIWSPEPPVRLNPFSDSEAIPIVEV